MAHVLPGLEGTSFEDLGRNQWLYEYQDNTILNCMILRAAAIALEEREGAYKDETSWTNYMMTAFRLNEQDLEQVEKSGGTFYMTTLFALYFMYVEGMPKSFDNMDAFLRDHANSEAVGNLLALPYSRYEIDGRFFETFFTTLLKSIDQRDNADEVIEAADAILEEYGDGEGSILDFGISDEYIIVDYKKTFVSDQGIKSELISAIDNAIFWLDANCGALDDEQRFYQAYALTTKLLDIRDGNRVACFGRDMTNSFFGAKAVGYSDDWRMIANNEIRSLIERDAFENDMDYVCARPLDVIGNEQFDRIACDFPLGLRTSALEGESKALLRCKQGLPEYGRALSADWTYARLVMDSLCKDGRAVLQVSDGALMNGADSRIRKHFLENGWVEGVVKLRDDGPIRKSLLVLSYGNDGVRFVDDSFSKSLDDEESVDDIRKMHEAHETGDAYSLYKSCSDPESDGGWSLFGERRAIYIPNEKIDQDSLLNVSRYLQADLLLENPVALDDIAERIGRGTSMAAWEILEMTSDEESKVKYLALSDIADGRASGKLVNIWEDMIDDKEEKHCARNGDLLLSRNEPMTVMVVELPDDEMLLVNGNTYIIRFDAEYMNPYYAAAFLSSRLGQEVVRRLCVGTKLKTLPRKMLKKVQVPMLPMDDQVRIATEYQARLDEIQVLNLRIERVREELLMSFNEGR